MAMQKLDRKLLNACDAPALLAQRLYFESFTSSNSIGAEEKALSKSAEELNVRPFTWRPGNLNDRLRSANGHG